MLVLAISGVLVGFAFLVISFVTENSTWAWGCIAACVAAALILFIDARRRRSGQPVASAGVVGAPVQRDVPIDEDDVPVAASADLPAQAATSVEPDPLSAAGEPEPVIVPAPVLVPAVVIRRLLDAPDPEPRPEAAPVLAVPGSLHDEASALVVATDAPTDEQGADAAALVVAGLDHEVLVVDEHPRYHLPDCTWLVGRETMSLPAREAVELGFTPCPRCSSDLTVASSARA